MSKWNSLRRLVAVALLIAGLVALPAPAVLAAEEESGQAAESEEQGIVEGAIDWLLGLFAPEEGDAGGQIDPAGRA